MKDRPILEIIHDLLIMYQRQRSEPSQSVARVVTVVERELQAMNCCPYCGREEKK